MVAYDGDDGADVTMLEELSKDLRTDKAARAGEEDNEWLIFSRGRLGINVSEAQPLALSGSNDGVVSINLCDEIE